MIYRFPDLNAFLRAAILGLVCFALPGVAVGQSSDTTVAVVATAQIRSPIVINVIASDSLLDFGHLKGDEGDQDGEVIVFPVDPPERTATGGATLLGAKMPDGGNFHPAQFTISGDKFATYTVTFVGPFSNAVSDVGPPELVVEKLTSSSGSFDINGVAKFFVGATVLVPARIRPGKFVATIKDINLIINYQ